MANISVETRAAQFTGFIQGYTRIDGSVATELESFIVDLLKLQDRDTRHAIAADMPTTETKSRAMNCCGGLIQTNKSNPSNK